MTREPCPADRRAILVTLTELAFTSGQACWWTGIALWPGHRFAGMLAEAFGGFDAGLSHVVDRLRTLLATPVRCPRSFGCATEGSEACLMTVHGGLRRPGSGDRMKLRLPDSLHGARCWANQSRAGMLAASKPLTYASK